MQNYKTHLFVNKILITDNKSSYCLIIINLHNFLILAVKILIIILLLNYLLFLEIIKKNIQILSIHIHI
jgi:hypothetical protein